MFLNNDVRVRKDKDSWTKPIIEEASSGGLVGPTVGVLDSELGFVCEAHKMPKFGIPYMSAWNLTASRKTWDSLILDDHCGPFSEEFGRAFFEDTDLSFRARELKIPFKIVSVPVYHFGHRTTNKVDTNGLYKTAREIFVKKWHGRINGISTS